MNNLLGTGRNNLLPELDKPPYGYSDAAYFAGSERSFVLGIPRLFQKSEAYGEEEDKVSVELLDEVDEGLSRSLSLSLSRSRSLLCSRSFCRDDLEDVS